LEYLNRFFTVIVIDEEYTSKLCSGCCQPLTLLEPEEGGRGFRKWRCDHGCRFGAKDGYHDPGPLILNKDRSACLNFLRIFTSYMLRGERPGLYTHDYQQELQRQQVRERRRERQR
jgi:hypothetical protein